MNIAKYSYCIAACLAIGATAVAEEHSAKGYVLFETSAVEETALPDGAKTTRIFNEGFSIAESGGGPLHDSRVKCVTTIVTAADGSMTFEHSMCDIMDAQGNQVFLYSAMDSTPNIFRGGTGKYRGISGKVEVGAVVTEWSDGSIHTPWTAEWKIEQ